MKWEASITLVIDAEDYNTALKRYEELTKNLTGVIDSFSLYTKRSLEL